LNQTINECNLQIELFIYVLVFLNRESEDKQDREYKEMYSKKTKIQDDFEELKKQQLSE
jgi:hypothetical protein